MDHVEYGISESGGMGLFKENNKLNKTWAEYAGFVGYHENSKSVSLECRRRIPHQRHRKYFPENHRRKCPKSKESDAWTGNRGV